MLIVYEIRPVPGLSHYAYYRKGIPFPVYINNRKKFKKGVGQGHKAWVKGEWPLRSPRRRIFLLALLFKHSIRILV